MARHRNEGTCIIEQCEKPMRARRWCTMHYHRWRKYGDAEYATRPHRLDGASCSIEGCEKDAISKGWCKVHYSRHWKTGTTDLTSDRTSDPEERFRLSVKREGDCLVWMGAKMPSGYGALRVDGKTAYAHRYAWERINGPIPDDRVIDHACHNRSCVNAAGGHLRLATSEENARNRAGAQPWRDLPRNVGEIEGRGFRAQVGSGGRNYYLGVYSTPEEASRVATSFRESNFGEFAGHA